MNYAKSINGGGAAAHHNHKDQRTRLCYIMQKEQECQNRPAVKTKQHFCIFLIAEDSSSSYSGAALPM